MRQSAFFMSIAALGLCVLWSNGRCAERPGTASASAAQRAAGATASAQETSSLNGGALDAALTRLLGTSFQATSTENFVVYHEPGARYVTGICETLEYAHAYFYEVFTQAGFELSASKDRLVWICFPQKSGFNRYALQVEGMDLSWLDGYYSTLTNRVAIVQTDRRAPRREESAPAAGSDIRVAVAADRSPREAILAMSAAGRPFDITRLTHEVAHQLAFNSGVQKRGVMYPLWVSEGLATNFEFDGGEDAGVEHCNNARCKGLLEAYHGGQLIPLRQFVVQTTVPPDMQISRRHYAQAWGFFHFILTERPEHLRIYLRRLADLRPYRRDANTMLAEFTEAFGSPEALEKSWNAFLERHARHALAGRLTASGAVGGQTPPEP
jgi:hypothetical protein